MRRQVILIGKWNLLIKHKLVLCISDRLYSLYIAPYFFEFVDKHRDVCQ